MLGWLEEFEVQTKNSAGNHVIALPAANDTRLDTFDIYDGKRKEFIATNVEEKSANAYVKVWNYLIDNRLDSLNVSWILENVEESSMG
jgi:hypothetical protein